MHPKDPPLVLITSREKTEVVAAVQFFVDLCIRAHFEVPFILVLIE
jgi:hypothetical protein